MSPERVQWTAAAASRKEILQTCASRYNREPPEDVDAKEGNEEEVFRYPCQYKTVKEVL